MDPSNKTVVITGGNKGIGFGISECFAKSGYNVFVGAREDTGVTSVLGKMVRFIKTDVRLEQDHKNLVSQAQSETGRVDVYINNAGLSGWKPISEIKSDFLDHLIDTNLKSVIWGCKAAASVMKEGSSIINISSLAGKRGSTNNTVYCATKFAVNGITQSLAKELGPKGIRVNALCPVLVTTPGLLDALSEKYAPGAGGAEEFIDNFRKGNAALGRLPMASEVGDTAIYLASEFASAITGQCINVDCGVLPQ
jgi:NAD(P)-dependent dehydrogenase (short-subunit alcohol dehydrogenase family)